jgi:hypothetical protein
LRLGAQQADSSPSDNTNLPALSQPAPGTVPRLIKFTGVVKDVSGKVPTGVVGLTFSLYELPEGGSALWEEEQSVQVDSLGRYTVLLGATSPGGLPLDLFTTGEALWLGVQGQLPGQAEQPRVLLVAVPYALKASDADTLGGKPASAFVTTDTPASASGQTQTPATTSLQGQTAILGLGTEDATSKPLSSVGGSGSKNYLPIWTNSSTLGSSTLYETGGNLGIGNTNPAGTLDVSGGAFIRGTLQLPAAGAATKTLGYNSNILDLQASAFNSKSSAAVPQLFRWQAEPVGNNTTSPSGQLNLLFGSAGASPAETGLSISSSGKLTVPGALLPATGTATSKQGYNSNPMDLQASSFNSGTSAAVGQLFRWQAEAVGNDTSSPGGKLSLLFASGAASPAETGLSIASNGLLTFASGQTFPGTGTITGVTAGTDLTGGGTTGTVTLNLDTTKVPTLAAASNTFRGSIAATSFSGNGSALTNLNPANLSAGTAGISITGNAATATNATQLGGLGPGAFAQLAAASNTFTGSITASGFAGNGSGLTSVNATLLMGQPPSAFQPAGSYATLAANTFTAKQTISSGDVSLSNGNLDLPQTTSASPGVGVGVITMGGTTSSFIHACCPKSLGNTFVGHLAGNFTADASNSESSMGDNTGLGGAALISLTSGYENTASGVTALFLDTTGSFNTASGVSALNSNTTGGDNTASGFNALYSNDAGSYNAAVGTCALLNTMRAGTSMSCGAFTPGQADANTATGAYAGKTNTTGNSNTFVGFQADATSATLTNATAIGANAVVSASNALVLGSINGVNGATSNVNVGIGTPSPQAPLDVAAEGGIRISLTDSALTNDNNELYFQDNGEIRSSDDNHRIIFDRQNNILEMREFGNIIFSPGATTGQRTQTVTLTSKGQVGIGTNGPTAELTVSTAGGDIIVGQSAGVNEFRVDGSGTGYFDGGTQTGGADFAESVAVHGQRSQYEPGDVLEIDPSADRHLALSHHAYSTLVAGIYSTKPGVLATPRRMDDPAIKASEVPLAVVGIVPCKVTAENGAIARGDLLVTSSRPGYAMKGTDRRQMLGAVVGKALQPLGEGTGVIEVLVTLQ